MSDAKGRPAYDEFRSESEGELPRRRSAIFSVKTDFSGIGGRTECRQCRANSRSDSLWDSPYAAFKPLSVLDVETYSRQKEKPNAAP